MPVSLDYKNCKFPISKFWDKGYGHLYDLFECSN